MTQRNWRKSRFDSDVADPMASMANLVDVMLVFACGLIAALVASQGGLQNHLKEGGEAISKTKELPNVPTGIGDAGSGYQAVGKVYKDPKTGKLILVGD